MGDAVALTEWERENQRREAERLERENNRLLRQQAESVRRAERDQRADLQHAAMIREQELQAQQEAAAAAARAADLEEERLGAQRAHNASVAAHQFTMWRQGTSNGERYEAWLDDVAPLLDAAAGRDDRWAAAREADIVAQREAHIKAAMGTIDHEKYRLVRKSYGAGAPAPRFNAFFGTAFLGFFLTLLVVWALLWLAYVTGPLAHIDGPTSNMILLYVAVALFVLSVGFQCVWRYPLARKYWRLTTATLQKAHSDLQTGFIDQLPGRWEAPGDTEIKNQLADAEELVEWMPAGYHEFRLPMLTVVPSRLPKALGPDDLDPRAANLRALALELSGERELSVG